MIYKNPIGKYFFRIENKFDKDNYSVNHLNFNPSIIKSNNGYIFEDVVSKNSFFFDKDDVFTYERKEEIFMAYSFYLNNRIRFYERTYQTVQEVLSIIGGISNFITIVFTIINDFINSYFILIDFNYLLGLFSITIDDIDLANRKNIINIKLKQIAKIKKNSHVFTKPSTLEKMINEIDTNKNKENAEEKETVTNQSLNTERIEEKKEQNPTIPISNEKLPEIKEKS